MVDETVHGIIKELTEKVNERMKREDLKVCPRDAHAIHHGVVRAHFTVNADVEPPLRHGVFATPKTYDAYVRYSNAGGDEHDADVDFRGMAIKLVGVEGARAIPHGIPEDERTTQDFVLVNCPVFFVPDAKTMLDFLVLRRRIRAAERDRDDTLADTLRHELGRTYPETLQSGIIWNPLRVAYYSQTPYELGRESIVKYQARPRGFREWRPPVPYWLQWIMCSKVMTPMLRRLRPQRYLRDAMKATFLRGRDVVFDFMIQRQTDPASMPIEDATRLWDERRSPFVPVATLRIPARENLDFDAAERLKVAEDMCFSPWHTLAAHTPVGSVNQARLEVYRQMAQYRHGRNAVQYEEPAVDKLGA